jgi:hypothetical protein
LQPSRCSKRGVESEQGERPKVIENLKARVERNSETDMRIYTYMNREREDLNDRDLLSED